MKFYIILLTALLLMWSCAAESDSGMASPNLSMNNQSSAYSIMNDQRSSYSSTDNESSSHSSMDNQSSAYSGMNDQSASYPDDSDSGSSVVQNKMQLTKLAFPASDLDGDGAFDLLIINVTNESGTDVYNSEILAISGRSGAILWEKDYPQTLAFAAIAGDLNRNGLADVMIDEVMTGNSLNPNSSLSAIDGGSGEIIWSRQHSTGITVAYPVRDSNEDDVPDILEHFIGADLLNGSLFTKISRIDGSDGAIIDEMSFVGGIAIETPAGNLTDDSVPDSVTAIIGINPSSMMMGDTGETNTSTTIEARNGRDRSLLWSKNVSGMAIASPVADLTGDEIDDLVVYLLKTENSLLADDISVLSGSDGTLLWTQGFEGSMAYALPGRDMTGEGLRDLVVYRLEQTGASGNLTVRETLAFKGDDGSELWGLDGVYLDGMFLNGLVSGGMSVDAMGLLMGGST